MIYVHNLHKKFGDAHILKGVDLHIREGKTRVILGLSGSGKSVLMKHLIGLMRPTSGDVVVNGESIVNYTKQELLALRRKFGMVFQQAALFDSMDVFDNIAFPLREHTKLSVTEIAQQVDEIIELVGLSHARHRFPSELSGGMAKRVGLARAVILKPKCVLYDEPTTGLDPLTTENVDRMIIEATEKLKVTSVVITHDLGSALNIADDIAVMHEGNIVENCSGPELKQSQHPFVKKYLATWFGKQ